MRVALVSCVSKKETGTHQARELYSSIWFQKAKAYAEQNYDKWYILSALHHLLEPTTEISNYDVTLHGRPREELEQWAQVVAGMIAERYCPEIEVHIYAGARYRRYLVPMLESKGYRVSVPLRGLGIGQQLQWLGERDSKDYIRKD